MKKLRDLFLGPPLRTLAIAESLTSGQVQASIGAISGASDFFLGGITAYTLEHKIKLLRVNEVHAREVNGVSERVAREMALGVCSLFGSELGIGTTGYAEPAPDLGICAPMAWWAICHIHQNKEPLIFSARIELPDFKRVETQEEVAHIVSIALTEYLQSMKK